MASAELLLESVVLLGCEVTTVLRSRAPLMLFEALSCPIPALASGAVWVHHPLGPLGYFMAPRGSQDPCLVKKLHMAQGELLFPGFSDPHPHPFSSSCFLRDSQCLCS